MHWTIYTEKERDAIADAIRKIKIEKSKPYEIICRRKTKKRTLPLNATYWLWLTAISQDTGNEKDDLHKMFSDRYLPKRSVFVFGREYTMAISTTGLDTAAFIVYMEKIQRDAAEYGIMLEWPSSPLFEQFYNTYRGRV